MSTFRFSRTRKNYEHEAAVAWILAACVLLGVVLVPTTAPGDTQTLPPAVLVIYRDWIAPGAEGEYVKAETDGKDACVRLKCPNSYLALSSVTGPKQAWFLSFFDTYAAAEQARDVYHKNQALADALGAVASREASLISSSDQLLAEYRPGLSYGSSGALTAGHYFAVAIVRVVPGHDEDFAAYARQEIAGGERARAGEASFTYRVSSGEPGNVYIILSPMRSLEEADRAGMTVVRDRGQAGGGPGRRRPLLSDSAADWENYLFAAEPKLSFLPQSWIDSDSDFWAPAGVHGD